MHTKIQVALVHGISRRKHNENHHAAKYSAPEIGIAEFSVENGFAASVNYDTFSLDAPDYEEGETI